MIQPLDSRFKSKHSVEERKVEKKKTNYSIMKLAIFLLLVTIVSVAYSGKPEVIEYIHFTVGGKGGDGATGGGVSRKPEDKAVDGPKIIRKIHII